MIDATQMRRVLRDSIRLYFAPLTGAFKGIRVELQRADREMEMHRKAEFKPKKDFAHHA